MKRLLAIAALLLASTAAQAQYTFEYGGRTIHVDPDRGTVRIPGVYDNTGRKEKRSKKDESDRPAKQSPQQAKSDPQPQSQQAPSVVPPAAPLATVAPAEPAAAALPPVPPPSTEPSTATAAATPADTQKTPPPSTPPVQQDATPVSPPPPAPAVAAVPPAPPPAPRPAAPMQVANSPLGVWLTEEKEGKVRIEQCGGNLCGYAVDKKSNQNGEQILINMKPGKDKWNGRILDPNSGSTYDSTIAMKGTDTLRVQGCAFGGMFCGGQTWTRVN
jgi:uncharacterized protein (DUF2147 family)